MRTSLVAVVVLAVAVVTGAFAAGMGEDPRTDLAQAVARIPAETGTASFTDWSRIRAGLGDDLDRGSQASVDAFLDTAYAHDLSTVSVLASSQQTMDREMGWSVLDLRWEMYSQSRRGAVLVLALSPSTDAAAVADGLRSVGYTEPESTPEGGGVWRTNERVAAAAPDLPDQFANVAVLGGEQVVVASDRAAYAERALDVVRWKVPAFGDGRPAVDLVRALRTPATAVLRDPARGCASTGYGDASEADRNAAHQAVGGSLARHRGLAFGVRERDGAQRMQVAMRFDSDAEAQEQLRVRRRLATGEAIGQGGAFDERFTVAGSSTDGPVGVLDLRLRSPRVQALSDLGEGPLLFAWCGP